MRAFCLLALLFLALPSLQIHAAELEKLIGQVQHTRNTDRGISPKEERIARKLQAIGPKAIPPLLPLLKDPNRNVRDLAAYTLAPMKGLTEEHLDTLIDSCRRETGGWIPPAIARIGTPKAVDFLFAELLRERQIGQVTWAIVSLGERGTPNLLKVCQTDDGWNDNLENVMDEIFHDLGTHAATAVDPLLNIVNDGNAPVAMRVHAMQALGAIGLTAERAVPDLQNLMEDSDRRLGDAATDSILRMGGPAAAPILALRLDDPKYIHDRIYIMREIAALHTDGRSAGAAVAKYLTSADWEVRICAIRTLGYIGYQENAGDFIKLLAGEEDWRVVLSAAQALGRLEARAALPALTKVAHDHWYPPVRSAATTATRGIREHIHPEAEDFSTEFFSYSEAGRGLEKLTESEIARIRFPFVTATNPVPDAVLKDYRHFGIIRCGIRVDDGYLVGRFRESGGEIAFTNFGDKSQTIITPPYTEAIYQTENGIFAVTGRDDNGAHTGLIYRFEKDPTGDWQAKPWRQLPGPPLFSRLLKDGRLFVNCDRGIVAISTNAGMQLLTRKQALRDPAPHR